MSADEAAGRDPATAHAQQTNLVERTAKQSDASEPPPKQFVGPEPTAHQSIGPQARDQHTNASALPAQQTNALARPPQHIDKLAPHAQKPDIASTHGQQSDASAPIAQQSVTAAPPAQLSGIDKPSAKQSVEASPSARQSTLQPTRRSARNASSTKKEVAKKATPTTTRKRSGRVKRKENDCLLLKALITQNQINSRLFESGSNIIFDGMDDEEVCLLLAKSKVVVLQACKYDHGQPFLVGEYFDECSSSCRELHEYCMDKMPEGHHGLLVHYNRDRFRHDAGSINVSFEDLHLFFNFNVLDATLVRCPIL